MHSPSSIAIGLALATAVSIISIAASRSEPSSKPEPATAYMVSIIEGDKGDVQHITTAKYWASTSEQAMRDCERDAALTLEGYRRQNFKIRVPPECGVVTPWTWVE